MKASRISAVFALAATTLLGGDAWGFEHIVREGDTLASIAEKYYGKIQFEKLLVAANLLDVAGGTSIVRGMRLEVPAIDHVRVRRGDTWDSLALSLLGSASRSDVLSIANDSSPWLTPEEGAEIIVPYNLRLIAGQGDSLVTFAYAFLGDKNKAWVLDRYNGFKGHPIQAGDVVLVPITALKLTDAGKAAARAAAVEVCSESAGEVRQNQRRIAQEIPALIADVRGGRYVDAVSRANRFIGSGNLTEPELGLIYRELTTSYVALDAPGPAAMACREWRKRDPAARLDPIAVSPKIIAACEHGSR